jgi:thiaminase
MNIFKTALKQHLQLHSSTLQKNTPQPKILKYHKYMYVTNNDDGFLL